MMRDEVAALRRARALSQAALAKALDVSRQTINSIENGRYDPSPAGSSHRSPLRAAGGRDLHLGLTGWLVVIEKGVVAFIEAARCFDLAPEIDDFTMVTTRAGVGDELGSTGCR